MDTFPVRKPNRLKNYDYSSNGFYHITICTKDHKKILSEIVTDYDNNPVVSLLPVGRIVEKYLKEIPEHYFFTSIVNYVIMPNHLHVILQIEDESYNDVKRIEDLPVYDRSKSVSNIIRQFKSAVTKSVGIAVWQKGFYDHVIKNEEDFENVFLYINDNPLKWESDDYY